MMHQHNRSVNVNRIALLEALRANLIEHRSEYAEAVTEYRKKLLSVLEKATSDINQSSDDELVRYRVQIPTAPANHEEDYIEVIEMLEMSVDENINLSVELFKAYIKNQWGWTSSFKTLVGSYKV